MGPLLKAVAAGAAKAFEPPKTCTTAGDAGKKLAHLVCKGEKDFADNAIKAIVDVLTDATQEAFAGKDGAPELAKLGAKVACIWTAAAIGIMAAAACPPAAPYAVSACGGIFATILAI